MLNCSLRRSVFLVLPVKFEVEKLINKFDVDVYFAIYKH